MLDAVEKSAANGNANVTVNPIIKVTAAMGIQFNEQARVTGRYKVRPDPLPLYNTIGEEEKAAVMEVLDSGVLSGFAAQPNREHFRESGLRRLKEPFVKNLMLNTPLLSILQQLPLHAAVAAMGVGPGDEVIVPPYTLSATATSVLFTGAVSRFCRYRIRLFLFDPKSVEANITPYTKGILVVNLYGQPAALFELRKLRKDMGCFC